MAYLYRHIRLDNNEVFYIGIGSDSEGYYKRAKSHKYRNYYPIRYDLKEINNQTFDLMKSKVY